MNVSSLHVDIKKTFSSDFLFFLFFSFFFFFFFFFFAKSPIKYEYFLKTDLFDPYFKPKQVLLLRSQSGSGIRGNKVKRNTLPPKSDFFLFFLFFIFFFFFFLQSLQSNTNIFLKQIYLIHTLNSNRFYYFRVKVDLELEAIKRYSTHLQN